MASTLYEILGVSQSATAEEIKFAYRRQAMKWHPDRNPNNRKEAEDRFKEIGYAYKVLSDPAQRAEYDEYLASQRVPGAAQRQKDETAFGAGMSDADAAKIFFEQMLDLAFELARRGFSESKILKALMALDCPEAIAKAVAQMVVQTANPQGATQAHSAPPPRSTPLQSANSVEALSWDDAAPYYAAVIGGVHAYERMDEVEYQETLAKMRMGIVGYIVSIVGIILVLLMAHANIISENQISWFFGGIGVILIASFIWRIKKGSRAFLREHVMQYYLKIFESYHTGRPFPFLTPINGAGFFRCPFPFLIPINGTGLFFVIGLVYRRMYIYAFILFVATIVDGFISGFIGSPCYFSLLCWIAVILMFNRIYFRSARIRINKVLSLPPEQALSELRKQGGTSVRAVVVYLLLVGTLSALVNETVRKNVVQNAAQIEQHSAGNEVRRQAVDQSATPEQDPDSAISSLNRRAEQGEAHAQFVLGLGQLGEGGDYRKAVEWFWKAANQGHEVAQYFLGWMYDKGLGVP
jgi:hypothetical protein